MENDTNKLKQLMQPVAVVLSYDLEKLKSEDESKRVALWNQVRSIEGIFEKEYFHKLPENERAVKTSEFTLVKLLLAAAAKANGEKSPIIKRFSNVEFELVSNFERYNIFDVINTEEIAERMYRRKEIYDLAMGYYRSEYGKLDTMLESPDVKKDLKIAFNRRYRERLDKVMKGVQLYIGKYGFEETVGQMKNTTGEEKPAEKSATAYPNPVQSNVNLPQSNQPKHWWLLHHQSLTIILSTTAIVLGLLGWQFVPWLQSRTPSYTVNYLIQPGNGGTVIQSPMPDENGKYKQGTRVKLEAEPAAGFQFIRWSGDGLGTMTSIVITVDGDKTVIAEFVQSK